MRRGAKKLRWKQSKRYQATRRRKSLHGRKVHEAVALGKTIIIEKISYKAWQKQFGKVRSVSSKSRRSRDDELANTRQLVA
ncbi:hypothetical protein KSX_58250 [Ktedonospora formicarum]|uniref:Uncharacterized protein n=1 Tax=Ktedonospora formicarum TaxID=2778364 RepID=A0A8J3I7V5_9CHLR|nr:hypothetical protein KSX_58250 [Ktedonospora formicarum]